MEDVSAEEIIRTAEDFRKKHELSIGAKLELMSILHDVRNRSYCAGKGVIPHPDDHDHPFRESEN